MIRRPSSEFATPPQRPTCYRCRRARSNCLCEAITPIDSPTRFVILQHPKESRNALGSARLAHLSLPGSVLWEGVDFSQDARILALLADPRVDCAILYPGPDAIPVEAWPRIEGRERALIVIDGTWDGAQSILSHSPNLRALPKVSFPATKLSAYEGVRHQPAPHCLSTLEAIGRVLALEGDPANEERILAPFRLLIERQLVYGELNLVRRVIPRSRE